MPYEGIKRDLLLPLLRPAVPLGQVGRTRLEDVGPGSLGDGGLRRVRPLRGEVVEQGSRAATEPRECNSVTEGRFVSCCAPALGKGWGCLCADKGRALAIRDSVGRSETFQMREVQKASLKNGLQTQGWVAIPITSHVGHLFVWSSRPINTTSRSFDKLN